MLTPEQLERRRSSIGASDVAAILGLDPYRTGLDIWLQKRGLAEVQDQTEASLMGHLLEPVVATRYAMVHPDVSLRTSETIVGNEPYFTATPDRVASTHKQEWLVEIKTKSRWTAERFGEAGTDQVPPEILCQVLWQMACTGMDHCDVAVLVDGREYREYGVPYDREVAASMQEQARDWWIRHIVNGQEPALTGPSAVAYLKEKFSAVQGDVIVATPTEEQMLHELAQARRAVAQAEQRVEAAQVALMARIADAPGLSGSVGKVSWRHQKGRTTTDYKRLVADLAVSEDLLAQYTTTGQPIRVFRFTPSKED